MALTFYPHSDDVQKGSLGDRIDILMEAAERYKAVILDATLSIEMPTEEEKLPAARFVPRDLQVSYNWEEVAAILREVREATESSKDDKFVKAEYLEKLAEVYEVLRAAKMPRLEAVRLALISEATQLRGRAAQVV